jgi:hypothetical protein
MSPIEIAWTWTKKGLGLLLLIAMCGVYAVGWAMKGAGSWLEPRAKLWVEAHL